MHPRTAVGATTLSVQQADRWCQFSIVASMSNLWTRAPSIVTTQRYLHRLAHHLDRIHVAASMDTSVSHFDSLAKYAAASFKKSRSCSTLASLRLSSIISLSCALPWPGKASSPCFFASSRQRRSCRVLNPSSSATSVSVTPSSFARLRASRLNSALYRRLRVKVHLHRPI